MALLGMFNWMRGSQAQLPAVREDPPLAAPKAEGQAPRPLPEWTSAELFGGLNSYAGPLVNRTTSMQVAAVYACVRLIAGAIAGLPLHVFKRGGDDRSRARNHPLDWILNGQPNSLMPPAVWLEYVVTSILLAGDSFNLITRTAGGQPLELIPLDPATVMVTRKNGMLVYLIQGDDGRWFAVDQGDMLHIPGVGFSLTTGRSLSVVAHAARQGIGIAMAAEEYSARFFSNGARPDVVLRYPNKLTPDQVNNLKEFWMRKHSGLANAHMPAVLTEGGDISTLSLNAEDAQLLEARKFQVIDIARAFGVPPFMIGETEKTSSWGSGIETQGIGFVTYTLSPHTKKIEQEINRKLLQTARFFVEFNFTGLLRADAAARGAYFRQAIGGAGQAGWMTQNEVRKLENMPAMPGGDQLHTGMAEPGAADPTKDKAGDDAQEDDAAGDDAPAPDNTAAGGNAN